MNDSIKYVIKNYMSIQISSFWVSYLERLVIFELFTSHGPLGCPEMGQNMWFDKNKCHNQTLYAK